MTIRHTVAAAALASAFVFPTACNRGEKAAPVAETQTESPARVPNQPMTITGCLRAGEAADTFVLTTSGTDVATYNLLGREGVDLREHAGKMVEVNGVLTAQQQTASRAEAPAADKATGTAGTPTVATRTNVDIRQLEVNTVRPTGQDCK